MTAKRHILRSSGNTTFLLNIALLGLLFGSSLLKAEAAKDTVPYGEALSGSVTLRIAELLENPEPYLGKKVTIEGLVEDVCPMAGCWIDVLDQQSQQKIRFKVDDGVIEFPTEAQGKSVVAEGILRKQELSQDQAVSYLRHLAEEKGQDFDAATVTGPLTLFQLQGSGAEISPTATRD